MERDLTFAFLNKDFVKSSTSLLDLSFTVGTSSMRKEDTYHTVLILRCLIGYQYSIVTVQPLVFLTFCFRNLAVYIVLKRHVVVP